MPKTPVQTTEAAATKQAAETGTAAEAPSVEAGKAADQLLSVADPIAQEAVEQTKETYDRLMTGAKDAQEALKSTVEAATSAGSEFSLAATAALYANTEAGFALLEALVRAKSPAEFIEMEAAYLQALVEISVEQGKEFQALTTEAAKDASHLVEHVFEKTLEELKAA
jgi:hypothetical protein